MSCSPCTEKQYESGFFSFTVYRVRPPPDFPVPISSQVLVGLPIETVNFADPAYELSETPPDVIGLVNDNLLHFRLAVPCKSSCFRVDVVLTNELNPELFDRGGFVPNLPPYTEFHLCFRTLRARCCPDHIPVSLENGIFDLFIPFTTYIPSSGLNPPDEPVNELTYLSGCISVTYSD
jgi:hypothetical protein